MYRLLTGLVAHLVRKETFNVIILGLDNAGKTTLLEHIKTVFSPAHPGLPPSSIAPTIGQNIGRVTLSSAHLLFWDLGGQRDLRTIWGKYLREADAVCWVLDSKDFERSGWNGIVGGPSPGGKGKGKERAVDQDAGNAWDNGDGDGRGEGWRELEAILRHPDLNTAGIPVLILANKQDPSPPAVYNLGSSTQPPSSTLPSQLPFPNDTPQTEGSREFQPSKNADDISPMRPEQIKEMFNRLMLLPAEKALPINISEAKILGVSALSGEGVREAVNWLFYRVAAKGQSRRTILQGGVE